MHSVHGLLPKIAGQLSGDLCDDRGRVNRFVRTAMKANEVEALSMLLSLNAIDVPSIEKMSTELLRLALPTDAAECALYLLNHLEELRRAKHNAQKAARAAAEEETEELRQLKLQNNNKRQRRERELLGGSWGPDNLENNNKQIRDDYIQESEAHCGEAPNSRALLTLAAEAMALCDGDGKPTPAMRCTRALLLQAHRLRKQTPQTGARILDTNEEPLVGSNGQAAIPWPSYPVDLPAGFLTKGGVGGLDLSLGGEAMPLQWINEVDDAVPPPIVFVRRCIDVDVHPNWRTHPCRPCNATMDAAEGERRQPLDGCRCVAQAKFPPSKPEAYCECNWACAHEENDRRPCTSQCARRTLQRGAPCRLQVFRHPMKGWCLRTLTPIKEGAFVMEYVAERVTPKRAEERQRDDYNVET